RGGRLPPGAGGAARRGARGHPGRRRGERTRDRRDNKADAADPLVLQRLLRNEKYAIAVSARTGAGIDELLALIDAELPRPSVEIEVLVPYIQGALVSRVHAEGEVLSEEHTADGTLLKAQVHEELAAELGTFVPVAH